MALVGNEVLYVQGVTAGGGLSPVSQSTTTAAIAGLGGGGVTQDIINTNITTVGNGTLTAAGMLGGLITRTGPVAAYTDTTDTAAAIVTAVGGFFLNATLPITIKNGTAFAETLTAGTGVTLPLTVIIPPNSVGYYYAVIGGTAAAPTVTIGHISTELLVGITPAQFSTAALAAGTLAAGLITGAAFTVLQNTGATPGAQTTRTATQMLADFSAARIGLSYILRIVNTGAGTLTLTADASVTLTGHAAILTNTFVDYVVTFLTATTASIQSVGAGTSP